MKGNKDQSYPYIYQNTGRLKLLLSSIPISHVRVLNSREKVSRNVQVGKHGMLPTSLTYARRSIYTQLESTPYREEEEEEDARLKLDENSCSKE